MEKSASLLLALHQIHLISNPGRNGPPLAFTTHGSVRPNRCPIPRRPEPLIECALLTIELAHEVTCQMPYTNCMVRTWRMLSAARCIERGPDRRRPIGDNKNTLLLDHMLSQIPKEDHDSVDSDSTTENAAGNMLLFPSCTTAIGRTPPYLPYKWVPSTDTNGL
ncbi:hypothetical protein PIB30_034791 [Stylosanthes scabra]|uniref:Uncharacterized protein n=1 Tax=Stylosanthes scabra TaxID=79078 RepID=A0ABU6SDA7_9FABA|nr:hypothetical protein [Stylosanthes scabra]